MNEFQDRLIADSANAVHSFSFGQSVLASTFYIGTVSAMYFLIRQAYDWRMQIVIVVLAVGYVAFKDFALQRQSKRILQGQADWLKGKRPQHDLYVPIFERQGKYVRMKRACFYFMQGNLYLEAFNQSKSGNVPSESIQVPAGADLTIASLAVCENANFLDGTGTLMGQPYAFSILNRPELADLFQPYLISNEPTIQGE
jgi:hypothetical protein